MNKNYGNYIRHTVVFENTNESGPAVVCTLFGANEFGISENQIGGPNGHNGAKVTVANSSHSKLRTEALTAPFCVVAMRYSASSFEQFIKYPVVYSDDAAGTIVSSLFNTLKYKSVNKLDHLSPLTIECEDYVFGVDKTVGVKISVLPKQSVTMVLFVVPWPNKEFPKEIDNDKYYTAVDKYYTAVLENLNKSGDPVICSIFGHENFGNTDQQKDPAARVTILESSHAQIRSESMNRPFEVKGLRYIVESSGQLALSGVVNRKGADPIYFNPLHYVTAFQTEPHQVDCPEANFTVDHSTSFDIPVLPGQKVVVLMWIGAQFDPGKTIEHTSISIEK